MSFISLESGETSFFCRLEVKMDLFSVLTAKMLFIWQMEVKMEVFWQKKVKIVFKLSLITISFT